MSSQLVLRFIVLVMLMGTSIGGINGFVNTEFENSKLFETIMGMVGGFFCSCIALIFLGGMAFVIFGVY